MDEDKELSEKSITSKAQLFFYGCIGAAAPDIVQLYAKRWTMPTVEFSITQYLIVSAIYLALGGVLGMLFAYRRSPQGALAIGIATPVVVGLLANSVKGVQTAVRDGGADTGTLLDLLIFP